MRFLVVGLGSIGRRHLANLRAVEPSAEIAVLRHTSTDANVPLGADRVFFALADAIAFAPDLALICGPSTSHVATALPLARAGIHLFIEKPLAASLEGIDELIAICVRRELGLAVGYNLRFLPSLITFREALLSGSIGRLMSLRAQVGQYLPDWRPSADYRETASARADLGGGALLELSHEIDYVSWIAGDVIDVSAYLGKLSDLEIDVEDTAEILLRFRSGAIGNIHLDMAQHAVTRTCRAAGTEGTLTWNGLTGNVQRFSASTRTWEELHSRDEERNEMYVLQTKALIEGLRERRPGLVTGVEGLRTLEIALAAKISARERRSIAISDVRGLRS